LQIPKCEEAGEKRRGAKRREKELSEIKGGEWREGRKGEGSIAALLLSHVKPEGE